MGIIDLHNCYRWRTALGVEIEQNAILIIYSYLAPAGPSFQALIVERFPVSQCSLVGRFSQEGELRASGLDHRERQPELMGAFCPDELQPGVQE